METKEAKALLQKYNEGKANGAESELLQFWLIHEATAGRPELDEASYVALSAEIRKELMDVVQPREVRLWPRIAVVAAAVTAMALCIYFFTAPKGGSHLEGSVATRDLLNDIAPGRSGATITLGDGKVIELSGEKKGVIVGKNGLVYSDHAPVISSEAADVSGLNSTDKGSLGALEMTASTAKGQTYEFTLPDGTHVWLNADSKISFPSQFNGKERKILLTGEGYFEVSKDKAHPFIVESRGQVLEVLGTHFNVNAYVNEPDVKTTLLEGLVKVHSLDLPPNDEFGRRVSSRTLKPGQQSSFENYGFELKNVDADEAIAWKEGLFRFNDEKIASIMKKLERWYNIEVRYEGVPSADGFTGKISRNNNISEVLMMLQQTKGVKFKVEGRRVTIIR